MFTICYSVFFAANTECFQDRPDHILNTTESCAIMSFTNLAYPQWYSVPCDIPIEAHLICVKPDFENRYKQRFSSGSNFAASAAQIFCGYGKIFFDKKCFSFTRKASRLAVRNSEFWKRARGCPYRKYDNRMNIIVIMEYLSLVSYLKPVFTFPASQESSEFFSWCYMSDVEYNRFYFATFVNVFFSVPKPTFHECTSETYHGIRRHEVRDHARVSPDIEAFLHCSINGKMLSYTKKETLRLIQDGIMFFGISDNKTHYYQYDALLKQLVLSKKGADTPGTDNFYIVREKLENTKLHELASLHKIYLCHSKEFVSQLHQHDGEEDCKSGDDETGQLACYYDGYMRNDSLCKTSCRRPECTCPNLYYQNLKGRCSPFHSNIKHNLGNLKLHFFDNVTKVSQRNIPYVDTESIVIQAHEKENKSTFIDHSHYLQSDCNMEELTSGDLRHFVNICHGLDEIPCTYGCRRCFPIHKLCVYELDQQGNLLYCPSGAHLKNCKKMECNNMFKCRKHYCIPFR